MGNKPNKEKVPKEEEGKKEDEGMHRFSLLLSNKQSKSSPIVFCFYFYKIEYRTDNHKHLLLSFGFIFTKF